MDSKLFVIFLTVFIDLFGCGIIIPILPNHAISLGASTFLTGLIAGVFSFMNFIMTPYLGQWSDKVGRRPILLLTVLMNSISYLILAFSNNLLMVFISRIIAGIGSSNISLAQAYIADVTPAEQRTRKMGLIGIAFGLGFVLGPPVGGYLKNIDIRHGIVYVGLFTSLLCFINLLFVFLFLKESHIHTNKNLVVSLKPIQNIKSFIVLPVIREYLWFWFMFMSAFGIFQVLSTIYWGQHCLLKDKEIGLLFGFIGMMSILWQGIGLRFILKFFNENQIIIIASVLMSMALLSLIFVDKWNVFPITYFILFIISMGNGLISPCVTSLVSQKSPPHTKGSLLGVFQSLNSLAKTFAPALGGVLYDINFSYPFIMASLIMIGAVRLIVKTRFYKI